MSKNPLTIGIDLDDVLLDFNRTLLKFHNANYGTAYVREEITNFHIDELWKCTFEEAVARIATFYETDLHWSAMPVAGAVSAIEKLREKHTLIIVTAKPDTLRERTHEWLDRHFPGSFKEVHFTGHFHGNADAIKRTKREVCDGIGVQLFIDDSFSNATDIVSADRPVLLLDSPWNQGDLPTNVTRVMDWEDILQNIEKIHQ